MNSSPRKARRQTNFESTVSKRDGGSDHDHGRMKMYRCARTRFSMNIAPLRTIGLARLADCFGVLADERSLGRSS